MIRFQITLAILRDFRSFFCCFPPTNRVVSRCIRFDLIDEGRDPMIAICWYVNIFLVALHASKMIYYLLSLIYS